MQLRYRNAKCTGPCVIWRVYTKLVASGTAVHMRWYWTRRLPHGTYESMVGFATRLECEADAVRHGCRPEHERRDEVPGLFPVVDRA
jgi:hypothetical protein